jgi:catecholate siderophore receptor
VTVDAGPARGDLRIVLQPAPLFEDVVVHAGADRIRTATKTDTPLRDVPQAVSVVSKKAMADLNMTSMADVVRYIPGVGYAQGEGNRDTPVFRGNSSTSDFYVDGVRDDVQYYRDVYNVERVEALKGPNAMIFGRGGVGGVINRVQRVADWMPGRELSLQTGSYDNRRVSADGQHSPHRHVREHGHLPVWRRPGAVRRESDHRGLVERANHFPRRLRTLS